MKAGLLILPFIALLIGAIGTAFGSAFPEAKWAMHVAWAVAAGVVGLWVALDFESFRRAFTRKGAKYGASSGVVVVLGIVAIVGVAVLTARPRFNKSVDVSRDGLNTLSEQSLKLIKNLEDKKEEVAVTAFFTDDQVKQQFQDLIGLYQAQGANFAVQYVDPQTDPTRAMAEKITDGNTVIFKHADQEKRITAFNEEKVTNALINVMKAKTKKIYFTKGHGEGELKSQDPSAYGILVADIEGNKNTVEQLSILEAAKIPDDADAVIIAGPKYDFAEEEARILGEYLKRGGSLLVMVNSMTPAVTLSKMLEQFGVKFNNDLLILPPNDVRAQMLGQNNAIVSEFDEFNPVTKDFSNKSQVAMIMGNTRSLEEVKDNAAKLKVTLAGKTADAIVKVKNVNQASDLNNLTEDRWEMGAWPVIAVANGKTTAPATAANDKATNAADTKTDAAQSGQAPGSKETRLIVVGSTEFANNRGAQVPQNKDMLSNMVNYLLQDDDFIAIKPKDPSKSTIDLTSGSSQMTLLLLAFIYPFAFLGGGVVSWLQRRRA